MKKARTLVLLAIAAVVLLAGGLVLRARAVDRARPPRPPVPRLARFAGSAGAARVPAPKPIALAEMKVPCWGCSGSDKWAVTFQTDLDLLAPLGDGTANAALWLKDFARQTGAREGDAAAAMKRRVDAKEPYGKALPPNDPLLLEAEPWADQATMRFYPDVFAVEGFETRIPDLLISLTLARSWAARAASRPDSPQAYDDCRRAIRWGRLLRQEDTTLIQDLVGLNCVRLGAQALYDVARARGDQVTALAAAIVLGEHAPQRLRTAQLVTEIDVFSDPGAKVDEERLGRVLGAAKSSPDRRFRAEAITQLAVARARGSKAQRGKVDLALDEIAAGKDVVLSTMARWARTAKFTPDLLDLVTKVSR